MTETHHHCDWQDYVDHGRDTGRLTAQEERADGHYFPRTDEAVRTIARQNVLGAEPRYRDAYINAYLDAYSAVWR